MERFFFFHAEIPISTKMNYALIIQGEKKERRPFQSSCLFLTQPMKRVNKPGAELPGFKNI